MKSMQDIMNEVNQKEHDLIRKTIIFLSPLTGDYEYRVAYFSDSMEAHIWEDIMLNDYKNLGITCEVHTSVVSHV